jgi:hypothetical protein
MDLEYKTVGESKILNNLDYKFWIRVKKNGVPVLIFAGFPHRFYY